MRDKAAPALTRRQTEAVPCPLCGEEVRNGRRRRGLEGVDVYPTICPADGMVFLSPRWSHQSYAAFYSDGYDGVFASRTGDPAEAEILAPLADEIADRLANAGITLEGRSLLDVGAGYGWVAERLARHHGADVAVIEPSENARRAMKRRGLAVLGSWPQDVAGTFDVLTARHVVEHLLDPVAELRAMRALLLDDGVFYVAVPDMMNPSLPLTGRWWRAVHTSYFSAATLAAVAAKAGLEVVDAGTAGHELWMVLRHGEAQARAETAAEQRRVLRWAEFRDRLHMIKQVIRRRRAVREP